MIRGGQKSDKKIIMWSTVLYRNHVILMWTFIGSVRRPVDRDKRQQKSSEVADES